MFLGREARWPRWRCRRLRNTRVPEAAGAVLVPRGGEAFLRWKVCLPRGGTWKKRDIPKAGSAATTRRYLGEVRHCSWVRNSFKVKGGVSLGEVPLFISVTTPIPVFLWGKKR